MMKKLALFLVAVIIVSLFAGCGDKGADAYVESVSMICGIGSTSNADRFSGIVSPQGETKIEKTGSNEVSQIKVKVGDAVEKDQVLFTYDTSQLELDIERAKLELEQMKLSKENKKDEKAQLEAEKANAPEDQQLSYTLAIQEAETNIQEIDFSITSKNKEIQQMQKSISDSSVKSPVAGSVKSINENGGTDSSGNPLPFMTIVETDGYKVKGYVNENNMSALSAGMSVIIKSRVDDKVWYGTVSFIDLENPSQGTSYYDDETAMSSKYPFYVDIAESEGLLLGQHVYIEPDFGQSTEISGIWLPSYYINDADGSAWVWAQDSNGKLEKRDIVLGEYISDMDIYMIESGLGADDYIAFPDESLSEGMNCVIYDENTFEPEDGGDGLSDDEMMVPDDGEVVPDDGSMVEPYTEEELA